MISRRAPGQRRRRTRREEELAQVEASDPAKHAELLELRKVNPQAYRKELGRLVNRGVIARGRGFEVPEEALSLLAAGSAKKVVAAIRSALEGGLGFRAVAGLLEAERAGAARASVVACLEQAWTDVLAAENRSPV